MSLSRAVDTCDLPALIAKHCGQESVRYLGPKGGTIRDPRPGVTDHSPSFSVWQSQKGTWMWKKRGRNAGAGTAFTFLTSLGMTGPEARAELLAFTDTPGDWKPSEKAAPPPDVLEQAREKLADVKPVTHRAFQELQFRLKPLREDDKAARDLNRRGLWQAIGFQAFNLEGDLAFLIRGPQGRVYNVKRRRIPPGKRSKYQVIFPGLGTPAWCSPGYGQADRVLLIEGELNGVAAYHAACMMQQSLDVQGLAGADTWPFLEGLNREVWIYADGDSSGEAMRARLQDLSFRAGASRVRQLPSLPEGDYCDLLGKHGPGALWDAMTTQPERPETHWWPAEHESRFAARQYPMLGPPTSDPEWPLQRPKRE